MANVFYLSSSLSMAAIIDFRVNTSWSALDKIVRYLLPNRSIIVFFRSSFIFSSQEQLIQKWHPECRIRKAWRRGEQAAINFERTHGQKHVRIDGRLFLYERAPNRRVTIRTSGSFLSSVRTDAFYVESSVLWQMSVCKWRRPLTSAAANECG